MICIPASVPLGRTTRGLFSTVSQSPAAGTSCPQQPSAPDCAFITFFLSPDSAALPLPRVSQDELQINSLHSNPLVRDGSWGPRLKTQSIPEERGQTHLSTERGVPGDIS